MVSLSDEGIKVGKNYVDDIRARFGAAVLEESWQAPDQVTILVELNRLPDVVKAFIMIMVAGWLQSQRMMNVRSMVILRSIIFSRWKAG